MATHGWRSGHSVAKWLFDEPYRFDFYQAVRLLEGMHPDRHSVGDSGDPEREVVRFRSHVALTFPPSDIRDIVVAAAGATPTMTVNFLGLAGVTGPLPYAYTEVILERAGNKDSALLDFLNVFNHRLVPQMYRNRKLHRVGYDPNLAENTLFAKMLFSLGGFGEPAIRKQFASVVGKGKVNVTALGAGANGHGTNGHNANGHNANGNGHAANSTPEAREGFGSLVDRTLLQYVGMFSRNMRSLIGLEALVAAHFRVGVRGHALKGRWLHVGADDVTRIGPTGINNALGVAMLGVKVWDQMGGVELEIGPLNDRQYQSFLPSAQA
ncbi:MAG: type VI secretion system baseplate subunit TssG, partial [bacterium]|nr:type VI secretion system baseplate subunit TssG [Candidatus Kapabacteria bacterium]